MERQTQVATANADCFEAGRYFRKEYYSALDIDLAVKLEFRKIHVGKKELFMFATREESTMKGVKLYERRTKRT